MHSTPATRGILTIAAGHFLYDTLAAVRDVKADGVAFVVHGALASALFCGSSLGGQAWNFWAIAYFLWELSTPFVHALYFLGETPSSQRAYPLFHGALPV